MFKALLLTLTLATMSADAAVIVYKQKIAVTETGGGVTKRYTMAGYVVYDTATSAITQIQHFPSTKQFWTMEWDNYVIDYTFAGGRWHTMVVQADASKRCRKGVSPSHCRNSN
jgi:hypothetical protein